MDVLSLERRYSRYLRLVERIKSEIEKRYSSFPIVVHENDDWLLINQLGSAPGEIFRVSRKGQRIQLFDRTACRTGEKDRGTIALFDLESDDDDDRLVDDFFYIFQHTLPEAISRQKRWWEVQKMKMAAEDGYEEELDE